MTFEKILIFRKYFFINKIFIDEIEVKELKNDFKNKSYILFQFKILCLPNDTLFNIKREFRDNNVNIKNIFF